jgi:hypothetical protein
MSNQPRTGYPRAALFLVLGVVAGAFVGAVGPGLAGAATQTADVPSSQVIGASVTSTGNVLLNESSRVQRVQTLGVGSYSVEFTRPVDTCIVTASVWASGTAGFVSVTDRPNTSNQILVSTFDSAGTPAARSFKILGVCG